METERYKWFSYKITTDPEFMDEQHAITPELRNIQESIYKEIVEGKPREKTIQKLLMLIQRYPNNPQLKNYLTIAYKNAGNDTKAREANRWIVAEHPDYLFGKLNMAAEYYEDGKYEKIPEVLGDEMEIQGLYPDRDVFHLTEVISFYKIAILYFVATENLEAAKGRLDILEEIAPGHPDTEFAFRMVMKGNLDKSLSMWDEDEKKKFHVVPVSGTLPPQVTKEPVFQNQLVHRLYESGLYIEESLIHEILELPRQSLVADLELILHDLLVRYEFFKQKVDKEGWNEEHMGFPVHTVMLLAELRAEESLSKVLEVLRQDHEFLEFWFEDHLTESLWEPIYYLGNRQLNDLKKFVQEQGVYTYAKTAVCRAVSQIHFHQPERKEEVIRWFSDVLEFFKNSSPEDNVIDSDAIGLIIWEVTDLRYDKLLPIIKVLFSKQYVAEGIVGDYRSVQEDIKKEQEYPGKEDLLNMSGRYKKITTTWAGYTDGDGSLLDDEFDDYLDYEDVSETAPVRTTPKTGRNDPCPCGSGKKYKKCCMD
jgi:hypothetical protein